MSYLCTGTVRRWNLETQQLKGLQCKITQWKLSWKTIKLNSPPFAAAPSSWVFQWPSTHGGISRKVYNYRICFNFQICVLCDIWWCGKLLIVTIPNLFQMASIFMFWFSDSNKCQRARSPSAASSASYVQLAVHTDALPTTYSTHLSNNTNSITYLPQLWGSGLPSDGQPHHQLLHYCFGKVC